jgi:hypothetical protein
MNFRDLREQQDSCVPAPAVCRGAAEDCRPFDPKPDDPDWLARFSLAIRTISSSISLPIGDLPGVRRAHDPSNLRATSLRYHFKMVSGRAAVATSLRALRSSDTAKKCPCIKGFLKVVSHRVARPVSADTTPICLMAVSAALRLRYGQTKGRVILLSGVILPCWTVLDDGSAGHRDIHDLIVEDAPPDLGGWRENQRDLVLASALERAREFG